MIGQYRTLREKYSEAKLEDHFLRSSAAWLTSFPRNIGSNNGAFVDNSERELTITLSSDMVGGKTNFFFVRHTYASTSSETLPTSEGNVTVPQLAGSLSLRGRDTKIHVADYEVGTYELLYSSAEVITSLVIEGTTVVVLYRDEGQTHETAVKVSKNDVLILNYETWGKTVMKIGDHPLFYLLYRATAYETWPVLENNTLVRGGYLVRDGSVRGNELVISGDLNRTSTLEFVAPPQVRTVTFNGRHLDVEPTLYANHDCNHQSPLARRRVTCPRVFGIEITRKSSRD